MSGFVDDERRDALGPTELACRGDKATLFRLAAQLAAARPWFDPKPALAC